MPTRSQTLVPAWSQITTGTETVLIQILDRTAMICDSDAQPLPDAPAHIVSGFITVTPPTVAWMRAENDTARIVLTDNT